MEDRTAKERKRPRTSRSFCVPAKEIISRSYDLSLNRYKETEENEVQYSSPAAIIEELKTLDKEIQKSLADLEKLVG